MPPLGALGRTYLNREYRVWEDHAMPNDGVLQEFESPKRASSQIELVSDEPWAEEAVVSDHHEAPSMESQRDVHLRHQEDGTKNVEGTEAGSDVPAIDAANGVTTQQRERQARTRRASSRPPLATQCDHNAVRRWGGWRRCCHRTSSFPVFRLTSCHKCVLSRPRFLCCSTSA